MAKPLTTFLSWLGLGGSAMAENIGQQVAAPFVPLVDGLAAANVDTALQVATVWSAVERRANIIASLPLFTYWVKASGEKTLARNSLLYGLLHDSPNARMTSTEFWRAMMMNYDLRGNAYARIERNGAGEAYALWPMPADQVEVAVTDTGAMVYQYTIGNDVAILSADNVLHLKNLGNGTIGLKKLEYMRASMDEMGKAQATATRTFGSGGKPTGVLMVDKVLTPEHRAALRNNFAGLAEGNMSRLMVLEASMKYQQLSISPEDQQLLESRKFGVEEIARWFDVPPVLLHHANVTTWGSGIEQIIDGWYKLSVRPILVAIEQAINKRVLTPAQRAKYSVEFSLDALLRGNAAQRADLYSKLVQNGIATRAECRQLENLPPMDGTDQLTAQINLAPLHMLGQVRKGSSNATQEVNAFN